MVRHDRKIFFLKITLGVLFLLSIIPYKCIAQNDNIIKGTIHNEKAVPLPGANIRFSSDFDTLFTSSGKDGRFQFNDVKADSFHLRVTYVGFKTFKKSYEFDDVNVLELPKIVLKNDIKALSEILVTADQPMIIKEDSVLYDAGYYWLRPGSQAGDLVEQLPGISIDSDGNLTLFGEEIESIRVNGEEYFGGDISTALNNLPAEIIEQVQVVDDYGERAKFTGVKVGASEKVINLVTNTDQGYTIRPHAGVGSEKRYLGDVSVQMMDGSRQIATFVSLHNTANPFRIPMGFGSSVTIMGGGPSGSSSSLGRESKQYSGGVNYKNKFGEMVKMNGSYRFSGREDTNSGRSEEQTLFEDFTNINNRSYLNSSNEANHTFDYNFEFQPDSVNRFYLSPRVRVAPSRNNSETEYYIEQNNSETPRIIEGSSADQMERLNTTLNIPLRYLRRFSKQGRSLQAVFHTSFSKNDQDRQNQATNRVRRGDNPVDETTTNQRIEQQNNSFSINSNLSYTEPLGNQFIADIRYEMGYSNNTNTQEVFDLKGEDNMPTFVDSLETDFQRQSVQHKVMANIHRRSENHNFSVGVGLQQESLDGRENVEDIDVENSFFNVLASLQYQYKVSQGGYLQLGYNANTTTPTFQQLQPVTDYSNPQYPIVGNPDLDASYTHRLHLGYRKGFFGSGDFINAGVSFNQTQNKIIPNVITEFEDDNTIIQETRYLNVDGARYASLRAGAGKSIIGQKLVISSNGQLQYNNNLSFQNGRKANGPSWGWVHDLKLNSRVKDVVDATLMLAYNFNKTSSAGTSGINRNTKSLRLRFNGENYFFNDWVVGYRLSKALYNSFRGSTNPTNLTLSLKHEFLEKDKASLSIRGFDLLNQSDGINRSVLQNTITDRYMNNILGRYVMLTFSLRLQNFK